MFKSTKISKLTRFSAVFVLTAICCSLLTVSPTRGRDAAESASASPSSGGSGMREAGSFGQLPLLFEQNQGQAGRGVRFLGRGPGYTVLLGDNGAMLKLRRPNQPAATLRMEFVDRNPTATIGGVERIETRTNYYSGNDRRSWHTGVSNFAKVRYQNAYPGIDALFYAENNELEYDFVVAPNADPDSIKLRFNGAEKLAITETGDLQISVGGQMLEQHAPVSYQDVDGNRQSVASHFVLDAANEVSFIVGAYDHGRPLVIDPAMRYLTYIGGDNEDDDVDRVTVDAQLNTYLVGTTGSTDFTFDNIPRDSANDSAVFVAKVSPNGTQLLFLTILDGEEEEGGSDITRDSQGNIYIVGQTHSEHFPVLNAFQPTAPRCLRINNCTWRDADAFVTKLNSDGTLANSTYLGGRDFEIGTGIAVNAAGSLVYVTGETDSSSFPTFNAYQSGGVFGNGGDAFLTVMPMNGNAPVYSTQFGGNNTDEGMDVEVDAAGNAYVTGDTDSTDLPVKSAMQANNAGGKDSFIAKFNPLVSGDASLVYATYVGGAGGDYARAIAVTPVGKTYITGVTGSFNFPMLNAIDTTNVINEAFITSLNANGTLFASTFLGGNGQDFGNAITLDAGEVVYVTGSTTSSEFPRSLAFQNSRNGAQDAFVSKLRLGPSTSALISSSYLGGSGTENGTGIAVFGNKHIYVVGSTQSNDLPTNGGALKPDVILGSNHFQGFAAHILDTQRDTVGVYQPASTTYLLRNTISPTGQANIISIDFGLAGDIPVMADWNGDGIETTGTFNAGVWRYRNLNVFSGYPTQPFTFNFGQAGDIPVAGDWNGDGIETPGIYRPSTGEFLLSDSLVSPQVDHTVTFGANQDRPVVGDWNGDGIDTPGTYRPADGRFRLTNAITGTPSAPDNTFQLGANQDLPVAGDWNGDGLEDVGLWKPSTLTFSFDTNKADGTDLPSLVFGAAGDLPLAGEWEGKP